MLIAATARTAVVAEFVVPSTEPRRRFRALEAAHRPVTAFQAAVVPHPVYLGLREDKTAGEVIRAIADPEATRVLYQPARPGKPGSAARKGWHGAVPPRQRTAALKTSAPVKTEGGTRRNGQKP